MEFTTPQGCKISLSVAIAMLIPDYELRVAMRLEKNGHVYLIRFDEASREIAKETVRAWAASPQVNLTWWDAGIICSTIDGEKVEVQS